MNMDLSLEPHLDKPHIRLIAEYQMMGDHDGYTWGGIVFGAAVNAGHISAYNVTGSYVGVYGIDLVTFTVDVPVGPGLPLTHEMDTDTLRERGLNLLCEIVGDSDVDLRYITGCYRHGPRIAPRGPHFAGPRPWYVRLDRQYENVFVAGPFPTAETAEIALTHGALIDGLCHEDCLDAYTTQDLPPLHDYDYLDTGEIIRRAALNFLHSRDPEDLDLGELADALGVNRADVEALG